MTLANIMILPADLNSAAAPALLEAFLARRGEDLTVDGAAVQRLGGQCLQILLAAQAAWAADGNPAVFETVSAELAGGLELFGVTAAQLAYHQVLAA